jgi:hypothetical protein
MVARLGWVYGKSLGFDLRRDVLGIACRLGFESRSMRRVHSQYTVGVGCRKLGSIGSNWV